MTKPIARLGGEQYSQQDNAQKQQAGPAPANPLNGAPKQQSNPANQPAGQQQFGIGGEQYQK